MKNINTTSVSSKQLRPQPFSPQLPGYQNRQRGTALLVAMVLIFMMSIMGMSTLRETSLERRMTTNAVQKSIAFQLAESAATRVSQDPDSLATAYNANGQSVEVLSETTPQGMEVKGHIRFIGESTATGSSLGNGFGFRTQMFDVRGEARHVEAQVSSTVRLGVQRENLN